MPTNSPPSVILTDTLASLNKAINIADQARQEVTQASTEGREARRERDEAVKALHECRLKEQAWRQESGVWKAAVEQAELTIKHHLDTISQLRHEAEQWKQQLLRLEDTLRQEAISWKEQFLRVEQKRYKLATHVDELVEDQLSYTSQAHASNTPITPMLCHSNSTTTTSHPDSSISTRLRRSLYAYHHLDDSQPPAGMSYDEVNISYQEKALDSIENGVDDPLDVDITMLPPSTAAPSSPIDPTKRPTFTPSTPGTSTIASGKRKAGRDSGDNMRTLARPPSSTKSASETGKSVKSQRVAIPEAFQDMSKEIHNLTNSFNRATDVMQERATQVALRPVVDPIPVRKQRAIIQLQNEGLDDHDVVEIIKHFQADVAVADSYLVIEKESTRKLFLSTYLKK